MNRQRDNRHIGARKLLHIRECPTCKERVKMLLSNGHSVFDIISAFKIRKPEVKL